VPIRIMSENNQHWPNVRIERAATLSSQEQLAANRHQLLRFTQSP
jgi:hypothetical protein